MNASREQHPPPGPVDLVFLVGTPRSGTTWLQLLLAQHPEVATSQETHLFSAYLGPILRRWDTETARSGVGLSRLLSEDEFLGACRDFAQKALRRIHDEKPSARVILEKSPNHVMNWEEIARVLPEARFIVLHRDPRAVVSSLMTASRSWAAGWAPDNALDGARYWNAHIASGKSLMNAEHDSVDVRYETLEADPSAELERLFGWMGIPADPGACREYAGRLTRGRSSEESEAGASRPPEMPPGFRAGPAQADRGGKRRGWQEALSTEDVRRIERVSKEFMEELGYEPAHPVRRRPTPMVRARIAAARVGDALGWRFDRWLRRM